VVSNSKTRLAADWRREAQINQFIFKTLLS
jgi:hypothetical protein